MIRNRKFLKAIAAFLILETIANTVAPAVSLALTSGPTAPEATSFEPVDTTDMVDLSTGDFVYNIPLLEVPGPSGGYPLSLSYHAGIQPNEDASWVGLGWTLNPGAITRNVNGFADDHAGVMNVNRYYWEGGQTTSYSVGVTVGQAGSPASVSFDLSISSDTYRGVGVGAGFSVGYGPLSASIQTDPYGGGSASVGVSAALVKDIKENTLMSGSLSVSTNGSVSLGISGKGISSTISTNGNGISMRASIYGNTYTSNSRTGYMSSNGDMGMVIIPIIPSVFSVSLGYNYQRYWVDQVDNTTAFGALHFPTSNTPNEFNTTFFNNKAYDTYRLLDPHLPGGIVDHPDPDKVEGGSFPGYDNYQVHAQGIFGSIRPYYYQKHLYKGNEYTTDSENVKHYQKLQFDIAKGQAKPDMTAEFRFLNDFSNRFEHTPGDISVADVMAYNFSSGTSTKIGEHAASNYSTNQVPGSRNIVWFTNADIIAKTPRVQQAGFMETFSTGFDRSDTDGSQIGGFTIVNESGVKYHFALPAYSFEDYMYSENINGPETFNEFYKRDRYAYTWYLTAITGPDYVDRSANGTPDGKLNEYDWGYWVALDYGKWTDHYAWRNPSETMKKDLDRNFRNFSEGIKELYYLDAIRTKTHTALFVKDIRNDAKSGLHFKRIKKWALGGVYYKEYKREEIVDATKQGGFIAQQASCSCSNSYTDENDPRIAIDDEKFSDNGTLNYFAKPTSSMKLQSVVLIKNDQLPAVISKAAGIEYRQTSSYAWSVTSNDLLEQYPQCDFSPMTIEHHMYQNVFDKYDLQQAGLEQKAVRIIKLTTDYSLVPETPNSFDFTPLKSSSPPVSSSSYPLTGKLTLTGLQVFGSDGTSKLPATKFNYELEDPTDFTVDIQSQNGSYIFKYWENDNLFKKGDIVKFNSNNKVVYALISRTDNEVRFLNILGKNQPVTGRTVMSYTKNPPYNKDRTDMWGYFKSDYSTVLASKSETLARTTSEQSSKSLDVWSLREVETPLGGRIKIEYEPDTYRKPVLYKSTFLPIQSMYKGTNGNYVFRLFDDLTEYDELVKGDKISYKIMISYPFNGTIDWCNYTWTEFRTFESLVYEGSFLVDKVYKQNEYTCIETTSNFDAHFEVRPEIVAGDWPETEESCDFFSKSPHGENTFTAGNLSITSLEENKGGGLRIKSIALQNLTTTSKVNYDYSLDANQKTSGVTSYEPSGLDEAVFKFPTGGSYWDADSIAHSKGKFQKALHRDFSHLMAVSREVPPPGVMYERVKVQASRIVDDVETFADSYSVYEFNVFDEEMVQLQYSEVYDEKFPYRLYNNQDFLKYNNKRTRKVTLRDFTSMVGAMKSVALYGADGNKITETVNHYLHDNVDLAMGENPTDATGYPGMLRSMFNGQGIIQETFTDSRFVKLTEIDNKFSLVGLITKREQYPVVSIGQTTTNFKTGIQNSSSTIAFDYYSGQPVKTVSADGHGNLFMSETVPAYRKYPAIGQGSKQGMNMLTQEAATYVYSIDANRNILGLVSGAAQTWSNQTPVIAPGQDKSSAQTQSSIWRKDARYQFVGTPTEAVSGNGYSLSGNHIFDAWQPGSTVPEGWQQLGKVTLYDVQSNPIEGSDLNNIYSAVKMTPDQSKVSAIAANARHEEFAYSGAEDGLQGLSLGNQLRIESGSGAHITNEAYHTGSHSLATTSTGFVFNNYLPSYKRYTVSVWSSQPDAQLKWLHMGQPIDLSPVVRKAGDWYLITASFTATGNNVYVWCQRNSSTQGTAEVFFDDFRIAPSNATMKSFVYQPDDLLTYILDDNNLYTRFIYDKLGRLEEVKRESFQFGVSRVSKNTTHYAKQN